MSSCTRVLSSLAGAAERQMIIDERQTLCNDSEGRWFTSPLGQYLYQIRFFITPQGCMVFWNTFHYQEMARIYLPNAQNSECQIFYFLTFNAERSKFLERTLSCTWPHAPRWLPISFVGLNMMWTSTIWVLSHTNNLQQTSICQVYQLHSQQSSSTLTPWSASFH